MKFTNSVLLLLASTATANAFVPASTAETSRARLAATVEETATSLVPPVSQSEIWAEAGRVSDIYDSNVQKTYG